MVFDTMMLFHVDEVGDEVALLSRIICLAMTQWYIHTIIPWAYDTMANCMTMPMFIMILPRWWWCNHTMIPSICMIMHDDDVVVLLPPALRVPPAETRLTVYRRPHIIRAQAAVHPGWGSDKFSSNVFSNCNCSAPRACQNFSSGQNGAIGSKFMPS